MQLSITYLDRNITQLLEVINQVDYELYKTAKEIDDDEKQFDRLSSEEQDNIKSTLKRVAFVGEIIKKNHFVQQEVLFLNL